MGEFYHNLASVYHLLFPARTGQLKLISELSGPAPARVLDLASGTGEYVAALTAQGYDAQGIELDPAMHAAAQVRYPELANRLLEGDMLRLTELAPGPFELAYCIGNSLPHLSSLEEMRSALKAMWKVTRPAGKVLIQTVNFDRVLDGLARSTGDEFELSTLRAEALQGEPISLERKYVCRVECGQPLPGSLSFSTKLSIGGWSHEDEVPLMILTRQLLTECLPKGTRAEWYGDFAGTPWGIAQPGSVVVLR